MLCGAAGAVFAAGAAKSRLNFLGLAGGFLAGALLMRPDRLPDITWIAGAILACAAFRVARPTAFANAIVSTCAGAVAAVWAALFQSQGVPLPAALPLAAGVPACSAWMSFRSPRYAPALIYEEALVMLIVFAAALAAAPGVTAGWQSAGALNLQGSRAVAQAVPEWTMLTMLISASLGGAYSLWTRR